jgi:Tfp pilus assembly protein PilF
MTTQEAVDHLIKELNNDPSYRISWQSNIAMAFYYSAYQYKKKTGRKYLTLVDIHSIANDAANNFISQLSKK